MLEPENSTDEAAADFVEHGPPDLHLHCTPYVFFRTRILFPRHLLRDLDALTDSEYEELRDDILKDLVGVRNGFNWLPAVATAVILLVVFYFAGLAERHLFVFVSTGLAVLFWGVWDLHRSRRYDNWLRAISTNAKLDILERLHSEKIIDAKCYRKYVKLLTDHS